MIIYIVTYFCLLYETITKSKKSLQILQQCLYNEDNYYLKWLKHNKRKAFFHIDILSIVFLIIGLFFNESIFKILCIFVSIITIFDTEILKYTIMIENNKKPLVHTKRIIRLIITLSIINILPLIISLLFNINIKISLIIESIILIMNYLIILLCNIINSPIEIIINKKYYLSAKKKIDNINNLSVIGISGSYGKTSCKYIVNELLKSDYQTLSSSGSTHTSIIKNINDNLKITDEIFITEISLNKIKKIVNLIKPKYVLLTYLDINDNLETLNESFTLIEKMSNDGIAFLNMDDYNQVNYKIKNKIKVIWYSMSNKNASFYVTKYNSSNKGSKFNIYIKETNKEYSIETKLLGKHNISNLVGCISVCYTMGININKIIKIIKNIKPLERRLEIKKEDNIYIIDDTCNSKLEGATCALEVLNMMDGKKILVTPGIINFNEDKENYILGKEATNICDYVILIGKEKTKLIYNGLIDKGYSKDRIITTNDVRQANMLVKKLKSNDNMYVLYENELSDIYNEEN